MTYNSKVHIKCFNIYHRQIVRQNEAVDLFAVGSIANHDVEVQVAEKVLVPLILFSFASNASRQ
jgi:hypothetical protein